MRKEQTVRPHIVLRPFRRDYRTGYQVVDTRRSKAGRVVGLVSGISGAREYGKVWDACLADGTPVSNTTAKTQALFPIGGGRGGGLWPSRITAVNAILAADHRRKQRRNRIAERAVEFETTTVRPT